MITPVDFKFQAVQLLLVCIPLECLQYELVNPRITFYKITAPTIDNVVKTICHSYGVSSQGAAVPEDRQPQLNDPTMGPVSLGT